jgi:replicative DNA helicase
MSYDIDLLKVCSSRKHYGRFKDHVKKYTVSTVTMDLFTGMEQYYAAYPDRETVDWKEFYTYFFVVLSKKVKDPAAYDMAMKAVAASGGAILDDVLRKLIELDYATQAYGVCLGVQSGKGKFEDIEPMLQSYRKEIGAAIKKEDLFVSPDLSYLKEVVGSGGLEWRLPEMNVSLGPLRKGDFIIIAARPESGKTTFVASEATHMLGQLADDECVIWINNEEASNKVMMRCIQSYHGVTSKELMEHADDFSNLWQANGGKRFLVLDDDSGVKSTNRIATLFQQFKPGLIIFDQLDKVHGFSNESRDDLRIGKLYEWARDIAKQYCPVIAVSQVDGSGEGEKWLHMNQLRGSKTDKIGEADAIITIGKSNDPSEGLKRFIHVPKNKLFGGKHTQEAHRHGAFEVLIEPTIARYVGHWKL